MEKKFIPYDFRILSPLETVYTGGTGETYGYVSLERSSTTDPSIGFADEIAGNKSPEDCLRYMLHSIRMLASYLPQVADSKDDELLDFLQATSRSMKSDGYLGLPIKLSPTIDKESAIELERLILESGLRLADDNSKEYAYIIPASGDFNGDEHDELRSASLVLDAAEAINQMQDIWCWKFKGKTICLAGKLSLGKKKKEFSALIEAAGFKRVEEIRKGLSFLAHEDPDSTAKKLIQAKKLGIGVISEQQLLTLLSSNDIAISG